MPRRPEAWAGLASDTPLLAVVDPGLTGAVAVAVKVPGCAPGHSSSSYLPWLVGEEGGVRVQDLEALVGDSWRCSGERLRLPGACG